MPHHFRRPAAATPCSHQLVMESLEPRMLLSDAPLLAPLPQSILAHTGRSEAVVVGDVDGDGWNDVLVGNQGTFTSGRSVSYTSGAALLSGRDGSTIREHNVAVPGTYQENDRFGASVAALGDVDGDGVADYAVSQPGRQSGFGFHEAERRVFVFSGAGGEAITILELAGDNLIGFGESLLGLGDVNGDGAPDLAIGALFGGVTLQGAVLIYSGSDWSVLDRIDGAPDLARRLSSAGDVDGDGAMDFIAAGDRVYSGATAGQLLILDTSAFAESPRQTILVSDLDGDGVRDFVSIFTDVVAAFSGASGAPIRTLLTDPLGFSAVANVGDRTGDGVDEIAVVSRTERVREHFYYNQIDVYSLADEAAPVLLQTIADYDMEATTPGTAVGDPRYFATSLHTGDVNGDGRTDLIALTSMLGDFGIASGPGRTDVYFGQEVGGPEEIFDPALLDGGSPLTVASADGLIVAGVNRYGDLIVFTRTSRTSPWRFDTLATEAGVLAFDAFHNPRTGGLSIAASTYDQFLLFSLGSSGQWQTTVIEQFSRITRLMQAFSFADGRIGIVGTGGGFRGSGDGLYLYEQSGGGWITTDITTDLYNHNQIQPDFHEFTVYVAPWNAVHITGRGPAGVSTVWKSHLTPHWVTTMIGQEVPEAQALTNLSAFVAPWGGLHVAGVTEDGHVGVLWWSFELLETGWEYTDLTVEQEGPRFKQAPITTYVTAWGGLNIAGVDESGDLAAYWWVPGFGADWVTEGVAIDPGAQAVINPAAILDSTFESRQSGMRIAGVSTAGEAILYSWRPSQGATWLFENLPDLVA